MGVRLLQDTPEGSTVLSDTGRGHSTQHLWVCMSLDNTEGLLAGTSKVTKGLHMPAFSLAVLTPAVPFY